MQTIAAAELEPQVIVPAAWAGCPGEIPGVAALEPDLVILQRRTALGAGGLVQFRHITVVVVLHPVHEELYVAAGLFCAQQGFGQQFFLGRIGGKTLGQRQFAADLGRVERIVQRIVEWLLLWDAQTVHNTFQRQALALLAGVGLQENTLQIVPLIGPVLVQAHQKQVLFQHRDVVQSPFGQLGVRPGPVQKLLQPLLHRQARVQIPLGQAGDLGDMVLQFAEDAWAQVDFKRIQHIAAGVDAHRADLDDFTAQRQFCAVIQEGFRLVADVPLQIKNNQIHGSRLL